MGEPAAAERATCRFCGGAALQTIFGGAPWHVARCRTCGQFSTVPWPSDADLATAYSDQYYQEFRMWADTAEERAQLKASYAVRVDLVERFATPPGRLVEIGTAMGPMVAAARERGWDAVGYDTSANAVESGRRAYGEFVRHGDIETARAEQPAADVVVAYHVLEHVPSPRAFLSAARAMLKAGGLLVIEVPHVGSFDARWLADVRERVLDLPRHLTHFTPETLRALLEQHGFAIQQVDGATSRVVHRLRASARQGARGGTVAPPLGGRRGLLAKVARRMLSGSSFCIYALKAEPPATNRGASPAVM